MYFVKGILFIFNRLVLEQICLSNLHPCFALAICDVLEIILGASATIEIY